MNDGLHRLMEAKKYQKMALMALLPESAGAHIEVIERELSAMLMEGAVELCRCAMDSKNEGAREEEKPKNTTRKVTID